MQIFDERIVKVKDKKRKDENDGSVIISYQGHVLGNYALVKVRVWFDGEKVVYASNLNLRFIGKFTQDNYFGQLLI